MDFVSMGEGRADCARAERLTSGERDGERQNEIESEYFLDKKEESTLRIPGGLVEF